MTLAAIYHRVSTTDQDATLARTELRAAVVARAMTTALDIEETGSGARNDRPGLQRVLDAVRRGQVQCVVVWKLDRFGRSALDVLANIRALKDAGCRFIVTSQGLDVRPDGDAVSTLLLTVLAAVAEFERDLIVERTRLGLDKARRAGKQLGRPPDPHAPSGASVRELRGQGISWAQIAKSLGCTSSAAQRAALRLPEKGVPIPSTVPVEKASAK